MREVDVVARYGGDEFLVVLPSTHFAGSVTVAERIWRDVTERRFSIDNNKFRAVTVSIGVALYPSRDVRTKDALLRAADGALQQAKRDGGNRICVFQQQGYIYTPSHGRRRHRGSAPASRPAGGGAPEARDDDVVPSVAPAASCDHPAAEHGSRGGRRPDARPPHAHSRGRRRAACAAAWRACS